MTEVRGQMQEDKEVKKVRRPEVGKGQRADIRFRVSGLRFQ
jgi:hypothetical protein